MGVFDCDIVMGHLDPMNTVESSNHFSRHFPHISDGFCWQPESPIEAKCIWRNLEVRKACSQQMYCLLPLRQTLTGRDSSTETDNITRSATRLAEVLPLKEK